MLICMRTTLDLDDSLMKAARQQAAAEGRTLTSLIEAALRVALTPQAQAAEPDVSLPVFRGDGTVPGVDLAHPTALRDAAFAEEDARYRAALHPDARP